jgi:hypothetical protein
VSDDYAHRLERKLLERRLESHMDAAQHALEVSPEDQDEIVAELFETLRDELLTDQLRRNVPPLIDEGQQLLMGLPGIIESLRSDGEHEAADRLQATARQAMSTLAEIRDLLGN